MRLQAFAAVLTLAAAAPAVAQDWTWNRALAAGKTIEVKGVNGRVTAVASSDNQVHVTATKTSRRDDPDEVELKVVEHAGGVTICAVYPAPRNRPDNECAPGREGRSNVQNNDVTVNFTVRVPRGVEFAGRTVNGDVRVTGLAADVQAYTVNGSVNVSTSGLARASTVNGSIDVSMGRANWDDVLEFETVNGSITIELPENVDTDVSASTVNGDIVSDFPLTVRGRFGPKRVSGTIGRGGRELSLGTVNGEIELRRR